MFDKGWALCYPALKSNDCGLENSVVLERPVIGIDLGGTKISTALVDRAGKIVAHDYRETLAAEGTQAVIGRMTRAACLRLMVFVV